MVFSFKCNKCDSRKFFSSFHHVDGTKYCGNCKILLDDQQKDKEKKKREKSRGLADLKLKEELEREGLKAKEKKVIKEKKIKKIIEKERIQNNKKKERFLSNKDLQELADSYDFFLYVHVTVKRLKAIEWRKGKKKIILNKEREIRRTHKGGWSQEKFQRFVDFQKKHALDWINGILVREGVLRPPYDQIVVESDDDNLKKGVEELLKEINY